MVTRLFHPDFLRALRRLNPATKVLLCPYCASPLTVNKLPIGVLGHIDCGSAACAHSGAKLRRAWRDAGLTPMPLYKVVECLNAVREEYYDAVVREAMNGNPVALAWLQCRGEAN